MKKNIFLGATILLGGVITGCSKSDKLMSNENEETLYSLEDKVEEENNSINFQDALTQYTNENNPVYIDNILIVNKDFGIPNDFATSLNEDVLEAFNEMKSDAKKEGIILNIRSGYRSFETQEMLKPVNTLQSLVIANIKQVLQ